MSDPTFDDRPVSGQPAESPEFAGDPGVRVVYSMAAAKPTTTIHVAGDLDQVSAAALVGAQQQSLRTFREHLHLDLSAVSFCNAAGLRTLITLVQQCRAAGTTVQLTASPRVERLIQITGVRIEGVEVTRADDTLVPAQLANGPWSTPVHQTGESSPTSILRTAVADLLTASAGSQEHIIAVLTAAASDLTKANSAHVGLTCRGQKAPQTQGSPGPLGQGLADAEWGAGEGPGQQSRREGVDVYVDDLQDASTRARWPRLVAFTRHLPVRSILSLNLATPRRGLGTLTLTAARPGAFSDADRDRGAILAASATLTLAAEQERRQLGEALTHRDLIGQAKGVLMARYRLTPQAAFAVLQTASNESNTKLHVIAQTVADTGEIGT